MAADIKVPFKNHDHIKVVAENFLKNYCSKDTYPIPIEEIVEFKLGLDIIPLPNLHKAFVGDTQRCANSIIFGSLFRYC